MRSHILSLSALLATFSLAVPAYAQGVVTIAPATGHPNLSVTISGSSFGHNEAIDIYVDTVDTMLLVSTATGTFSGSASIPASAQPGTHYVTAIGRHSGDAAQAAFSVTTPWTEQGFGAAHLGWNPYENTLNTQNVGSLGTLWQISVNGLGGAPAVAGTRVFVGTSAGLYAVSKTTGATLWTAFPSTSFYASPAIVGSTLYIGDGNNSLMYALNASTGAVIWSTATTGVFESSPLVTGKVVYAGCVDGKIYAFNATTGKIVWTYTTGGFIDSSPAVVNGTLYIGSADHKIYALDASTGALIWSYTTGGEVESAVAVSNGVVYVGSDDDKLYAINAAASNKGTLLWSYTTSGLVYSSPAVAYGFVYAGSSDGNMYAFNAHSGAVQWAVATGGPVESPAVANGVVYVSSRSNSLFAINAYYGGILATAVTGFSFLGNPTISDGVVYLNSYASNTYAFSLLAGVDTIKSHAKPPAPSSLHPDMSLTLNK
jgi:outer membrane protein assembly factor BamB